MNKKEVTEIRKQLNPVRCCLTQFAGCYVNGEKEIVSRVNKAFLSMEEEEIFKFLQLFQKTLSGTLGKQLLSLHYKEVHDSQKELLGLRDSRLKDPEQLETFFRKIIDSYQGDGNYYIAVVHGVYDIPGRTNDGAEMEDASDDVYEHILGMICPVVLDKPSLIYNTETKDVENKERDWILGNPNCGFLYPAFSDRTASVNEVLYYSRKTDDLEKELIREVFGASQPDTCVKQAEAFQAAAEAAGLTFDQAKTLKEELAIQELDNEGLTLDLPERKKLCSELGLDADRMEEVLHSQNVSSILASNVFQRNKTSISTDNVEIRVAADFTDLVQIRKVDGVDCLVIRPDGKIRFDGIPVMV